MIEVSLFLPVQLNYEQGLWLKFRVVQVVAERLCAFLLFPLMSSVCLAAFSNGSFIRVFHFLRNLTGCFQVFFKYGVNLQTRVTLNRMD